MKFDKILNSEKINPVDMKKVLEIAESIKANGWIGSPIYVDGDKNLLTGSHRFEAMKLLVKEDESFLDLDCVEEFDFDLVDEEEVEEYRNFTEYMQAKFN